MIREKLGFGGYKTIINGKPKKMGAWSGGPKDSDWAVLARLCKIGYPRVDKVKKIPGNRTYFWNDWIPGTDLWALRENWTEEIFYLWGKETAKIHNVNLSAWDLFPKNYVYDGKRVWFVDFKKLYLSDFPEYDVLKDIVFNMGFKQELKDAFLEGYRTEREFSDEYLLKKAIDHCYDNYQRIELDGQVVRTGARTLKRLQMIKGEDLVDSSVLDIGCSEGMFARYAAEKGAGKIVGVDMCTRDKRYRVVTLAALLALLRGYRNRIYFQHIDIESVMFLQQKSKYDVVFFCAILGHLKKTPRHEYMKFIEGLTSKVLYYESNLHGKREPTEAWIKEHTNFKKVEYLGNSGDDEKNFYSLFRCEK